ncbi:MAG: ABC transporter substrate-binding protein [Nitriliruptorales bacterium]|nr:ABC transporter substrate-binding protein [Nitriliruptorales bacterium]
MFVTKPVRIAVAALALALVATACGDDADTEATPTPTDGGTMTESMAYEFTTLTEGVLTICSDIPYAPFEVEDPDAPSGYSGFDIELVDAIAQRLDLTIEVKVTAFDPIQNGQALEADSCDIAASAMTINAEREENIDFTDPYFDADQSMLVKKDNPFASLDELAGQTVGVQADTTGQEYAEANVGADVTVREFPGAAELFQALEAGDIVAIIQDLPVNVERAQQDDTVEVTATFPTGEQYGFAVKQDRGDDLLQALNDTLAALRADGTYDTIYDSYFATS